MNPSGATRSTAPVGRASGWWTGRCRSGMRGDTRIVSLLQEVLVVEKQQRLTTDLHIRTQRVETPQNA
jgi:hypothetical protein